MEASKPRKRLAGILILVLLLAVIWPIAAHAEVPFSTFTRDSFGRVVYTQPAYAPIGTIGQDIYIEDDNGNKVYSPLKAPKDLFVDRNDHIYVADTDNNRIVHFDEHGEVVRVLTVPESPLNKPQGLFINEAGDIYVADSGNQRVARLNREGEFVQEFKRPKSRFINDSFVYEPINMVVDKRGFVYVISQGSYQGIVQFDPEGEFFGFFGTNSTEVSVMDRIRRMFYTKEQLSRQVRLLPTTIRNIDIDEQGFIYSVSGSKTEQVKKLNIRGDNLWKELSFTERSRYFRKGDSYPEAQLADVAVDANGNLTVIDKAMNIVAQYDPSGKLLFYWSGPVAAGIPLVGINQSPVAVDTNSSNEMFILDDSLNLIQVFKPTEFGAAVHTAYKLTQEGKYVESEAYWNQVVRLNALFTPAYEGLALSAFHKEDYKTALEMYRLAGNAEGYSDAFWQLRLQWFQHNFSILANSVLAVGVAGVAGGRLKKKFGWRLLPRTRPRWMEHIWLKQLGHAFYILRHPLDGFSDLRYLNRGGYISAIALLALVIMMLLAKVNLTSFSFNPVPANELRGAPIIVTFAVLLLTWMICHYLIGSISQGEARFKDVFVGSAYALFPIVLLGVPLALISNIMTLSENSIYSFFEWLMIGWSGLLFFWKIQSLQNYSVGETIVNILLTIVAMIALWVLIFIILGLSSEFVDFIYTLYQEVSM